MSGALLLAIDTSTRFAGAALYDGAVRFEATWESGRNHSQQVLPMIQRGIELTGNTTHIIAAVAAARGPGSFTGVRVGLTLARSLGFALSIPTLGVCSLDVLAEGQAPSELPVRPLLDIGRGRFATAEYVHRNGSMERIDEIRGLDLPELVELIRVPTRVCGDLDESARAWLIEQFGDVVKLASPAASVRRPAILAQIAWRRWQRGESEVFSSDPIYLSREAVGAVRH